MNWGRVVPNSFDLNPLDYQADDSLLAMKLRQLDKMKLETENVKSDGYSSKN